PPMTTTVWPSNSGSRWVGTAVVAVVMIPPVRLYASAKPPPWHRYCWLPARRTCGSHSRTHPLDNLGIRARFPRRQNLCRRVRLANENPARLWAHSPKEGSGGVSGTRTFRNDIVNRTRNAQKCDADHILPRRSPHISPITRYIRLEEGDTL